MSRIFPVGQVSRFRRAKIEHLFLVVNVEAGVKGHALLLIFQVDLLVGVLLLQVVIGIVVVAAMLLSSTFVEPVHGPKLGGGIQALVLYDFPLSGSISCLHRKQTVLCFTLDKFIGIVQLLDSCDS